MGLPNTARGQGTGGQDCAGYPPLPCDCQQQFQGRSGSEAKGKIISAGKNLPGFGRAG